jgi:soluble lytic murein transglycosylase
VKPDEAYRELSRDRSFHGFLAAARLGERPDLAPEATERDAEAQARIAGLAAIRRAREWYLLENDRRAAAELAFALEGADAKTHEQAAVMLADWGWHSQAIAWLARSDRWDDLLLRFPLPYEREFERAAKATGVPLAWLHTIVRTESLYDPRAVSSAGARGISQVMPGTASGIARRNRLPYRGADQLFDVRTNLLFGAHYLRELDEHFGGDWLLVIPAYNAGRHRIPGWMPSATLDADVWMENIPFHETRGYLQRALYHYVIVHWRLTGEPADLSPWLDRTVPATAASPRSDDRRASGGVAGYPSRASQIARSGSCGASSTRGSGPSSSVARRGDA